MNDTLELIERLRKRAEIRRQITTRKSVLEGKPDRISEVLDEAATKIESLDNDNERLVLELDRMKARKETILELEALLDQIIFEHVNGQNRRCGYDEDGELTTCDPQCPIGAARSYRSL